MVVNIYAIFLYSEGWKTNYTSQNPLQLGLWMWFCINQSDALTTVKPWLCFCCIFSLHWRKETMIEKFYFSLAVLAKIPLFKNHSLASYDKVWTVCISSGTTVEPIAVMTLLDHGRFLRPVVSWLWYFPDLLVLLTKEVEMWFWNWKIADCKCFSRSLGACISFLALP